jgi:deazaflavin-dependent oxidoreductase (nitroreductase family)
VAGALTFDTGRGTRGARQPSGRVMRWMNSMMVRRLRRPGKGRVRDFDALILTTVGRKSGMERTTPVGWFPDADGSWLIVASANGAVDNPAWYYNLAANPDRARIEVRGEIVAVTAEQLHGSERQQAWERIIKAAPSFAKYEDKTDREIPVIKLTRQPSVG